MKEPRPESCTETPLPADHAAEPDSVAAERKQAFGLWPNVEDGLMYQERLRSEWDGHVDE